MTKKTEALLKISKWTLEDSNDGKPMPSMNQHREWERLYSAAINDMKEIAEAALEAADEATAAAVGECACNGYLHYACQFNGKGEFTATQPTQREPLFKSGNFALHSGDESTFKIDCDALTDSDWESLAHIAVDRVGLASFGRVEGVPKGGLKFAEKIEFFNNPGSDKLLIVDDVFTTGTSMEEQRAGRDAIGVVLFARSKTPDWITPIFTLSTPPATQPTQSERCDWKQLFFDTLNRFEKYALDGSEADLEGGEKFLMKMRHDFPAADEPVCDPSERCCFLYDDIECDIRRDMHYDDMGHKFQPATQASEDSDALLP